MAKIKTLVVEDDAIWLEHLLKQLSNDIFEVKVARDTANITDALRTNRFDLIVLDLILPDSPAANTIQLTTLLSYGTPIIIVTSLKDDYISQLALSYGVQDFIIKNEFKIETFIHAALMAIKRTNAVFVANFKKNIETTKRNLLSLAKTLNVELDDMETKKESCLK